MIAERTRWEERHAAGTSSGLPSPFVERHARAVAARRPGGLALDLACGSGRHCRLLAELGLVTVALDFARPALALAAPPRSGIHAVAADAGQLPFTPGSFDLIVQTCFLERELFPRLAALLAPGGLLVAETFLEAQFEATGHPRREYCLAPGELERLCRRPDVALEPIDAAAGERRAGALRQFLASIAARRP